MKKAFVFGSFALLMAACSPSVNNVDNNANSIPQTGVPLQAISVDDPIIVNDSGMSNSQNLAKTHWGTLTHQNVATIAALQWGLSAGRAAVITDASIYPDVYQSGIEHGYAQQWDHAYIYDCTLGSTYYLWGGADEDFHDNILGPRGGDGYNGLYAGYYYNANDQLNGDKYLGYAMHYIQDVSITLHSTAPTSIGLTVPYYTVDMLIHHSDYETWVDNNLTKGWNLLDAVNTDYYYYPVTDPVQAIKSAACMSCSYKGTSSPGYSAWKAYRACGYPTSAGSGNATLVANTKVMMIAAGRWAKGAIKYTLDNYGQWTSKY